MTVFTDFILYASQVSAIRVTGSEAISITELYFTRLTKDFLSLVCFGKETKKDNFSVKSSSIELLEIPFKAVS